MDHGKWVVIWPQQKQLLDMGNTELRRLRTVKNEPSRKKYDTNTRVVL